MQALKAFVIFMGLLIVAGLTLVVYALMTRVSDDKPSARGFGNIALPLPAGCSIAETSVGEGRLILRTDGASADGSCREIILIDLETGGVLGRIRLEKAP